MIHLSGKLICTNEQEVAIVRAFLPEHIRLSRAEPGCLGFAVLPTADPLVWQVDESFVDAPAFEAHQSRTKASAWFAATSGIQRAFRSWSDERILPSG